MDKTSNLQKFESYLTDRKCRPGTVKVYTYALGLWFSFLNGNEPSKKTAQLYIESLIKKNLSPSTVNLRAHAIRRWFKSRGESLELDYPTSDYYKEPEYLEIEEIEKVIAVCRTPLERALIIVLFDTGVRISELLNVHVDGINWGRKLLSVIRKGGKEALVNVSDKGLQALQEWLDSRQFNTDRVFGSLEYYDAWRLIKSIGKRTGLSGVNIHPHIFRHSRAIYMLMNDAEYHDVQQHLGHKSITTTLNIYGKFKAIHLRKRIPEW